MALKDTFQAKATLQSIIENSDNAELIKEAQQKLDAINKSEAAAENALKPDLIEIPFDTTRLENLKLFEEQIKKQ